MEFLQKGRSMSQAAEIRPHKMQALPYSYIKNGLLARLSNHIPPLRQAGRSVWYIFRLPTRLLGGCGGTMDGFFYPSQKKNGTTKKYEYN